MDGSRVGSWRTRWVQKATHMNSEDWKGIPIKWYKYGKSMGARM